MTVQSTWLNTLHGWAREHFFRYPTNVTLGYLWSFGSLAGFCLILQIVSGLLLAIHYLPAADSAFFTIEQITREVNYGWLIRYAHSNGASFFFIVLYIHIFRSLLTASYSRSWNNAWTLGVIIFILVIATAFFGYVLPWGQMSLWGATVITNLFSAVPVIGPKLVLWLWGGFSVDTPTLGKFFTLHFLLPFVIAALALLHILFLHEAGSSSQLGTISLRDQKNFFSYYSIKDLLGILYLLFLLGAVIIYAPNMLGHPDNYIEANHMVTPLHIVPEWYFLPFYAILRSVPNKLNGVILMFGALVMLLIFPYLQYGYGSRIDRKEKDLFIPHYILNNTHSAQLNILHQIVIAYFAVVFVLLGWLGGKPAVEPFTTVSLWLSIAYFVLLMLTRTASNTWWYLLSVRILESEMLSQKQKPKTLDGEGKSEAKEKKNDELKKELERVPFGSRKIIPDKNFERFDSRHAPRTPCPARSTTPHKHWVW